MSELLPGLESAPNIHPMFVHIPLALWLAALVFWLAGALTRRDRVFQAGRWIAYLAALGAVAAVATGLAAEAELGHHSPHHEAIHAHRNWMIAASVLGVGTALLAHATRRQTGRAIRWLLTALMALTVAVSTLGADRGAALIFRDGIGAPGRPAAAGHPEPPDER